MKKWNAASIKAAKGVHKLACLTAYDTGSARLADAAGIALLLVGDSLGMTVLGYDSTLPVTMATAPPHCGGYARRDLRDGCRRHAFLLPDQPRRGVS